MDKISQEELKFILQRFDVYINSANTKGAFLLAFNTFLCGGILSNYELLLHLVRPSLTIYLNAGLCLLSVAGIVCLVIVLLAVYPFTKAGNSSTNGYHSVIYFGSVSEFESSGEYLEKLQTVDQTAFDVDLSKQIHGLAKALKSKYSKLKWATKVVFLQLVILLVIVVFILIGRP